MGVGKLNVGFGLPLHKTLKKAVATAALAGTLGLGLFMSAVAPAISGGETRTISLVHQHTKESLTVTYKVNGKYVPSAMKKLNRFFRDWRRNEVTNIDPRTIDLVWELHADLGSKRPIHIVSGYRSPKTNAFLKRIGRNVAKKSQHMKGKAIDFFFPDVNTKTIRNSALARRVGGVGYYRSSGGPTGFLHADSGNVRHWGPKISRSELASIISQGRKTIGRRVGKKGVFDGAAEAETVVAAAERKGKKSGGILGWWKGDSKQGEPEAASVVAAAEEPPLESIYTSDDDELADLSADAAAAESADAKAKAKKKLVEEPVAPAFVDATPAVDESMTKKDRSALAALAGTATVEEQAEAKSKKLSAASMAFLPRLKPKVVQQIAEASTADEINIQPASATPDQGFNKGPRKPSPVDDAVVASVDAGESLTDDAINLASNVDGKGNLKSDIVPPLRARVLAPLTAKTDSEMPEIIYAKQDAELRLMGVTPAADAVSSMMVPIELGPDGSGEKFVPAPTAAAGKADRQDVNRDGKGSLPFKKQKYANR